MIRLPDRDLPAATAKRLAGYQREVTSKRGYPAKVAEAKRLFDLRNKKGNAVFDVVKQTLDTMCSGARRCCYCEDSAADEVEHVKPKDFFPELVFVWENYLYACGPCNGPKGNRHALLAPGASAVTEIVRTKGEPMKRPPPGTPALIDPRAEDPTDFLELDLLGTFFLPKGKKGTLEYLRADHTIDVLGLNKRDLLPAARRSAFADYTAHLEAYARERDNGSAAAELTRRKRELLTRQHPSVWREMQRQATLVPKLRALFAAVPGAHRW